MKKLFVVLLFIALICVCTIEAKKSKFLFQQLYKRAQARKNQLKNQEILIQGFTVNLVGQ